MKIDVTRRFLGLALGGLALLGAGCGQTSYFSVDVFVTGPTGRDTAKMLQIETVEVKAEGSTFALDGFPRPSSYGYPRDKDSQIIIGKFQYGTTVESGDITFDITARDGSHEPLASGSGHGTIHAGNNVATSVGIDPVSTW